MVQKQRCDRLSYFQVVLEGVGRVGMLCLTLLGLTLAAQLTLGDFRTLLNWTEGGDPIILDKGDFVQAPLNPSVKGENCSHDGFSRARRSHFLTSVSASKGGHCRLAREGGGSGESYTSRVGAGREEVPPGLLAGSNVERDAHDEDTYYGTFVEVVQPQGANISALATPKTGVRPRGRGMKKRSPVSHHEKTRVGGSDKVQGLKKRSPVSSRTRGSHKAGVRDGAGRYLKQIHSPSTNDKTAYKAEESGAAQRQQKRSPPQIPEATNKAVFNVSEGEGTQKPNKRSPLSPKVDTNTTLESQDGGQGKQKQLNQIHATSSKVESQDKSCSGEAQGPQKRSLHLVQTVSNKGKAVGQESGPVKRSPQQPSQADPKRTLKVAGLIVDAVLGQAEATGMKSELGLCKGDVKITNPER